MQRYTVYFIWKLLYLFRVIPSPIIRSANNCIYSIWYLSHRYCYLPLSWKSWNWFECAVGGVPHPQHTVDTIVCAPDDGWRYCPKHVEQFPDKLCNVASCWIYVRTFLRCTDPWTLYSKRGQCNFKSYVWEILVNRNSSTYPPDVSFKVLLIYVNEMQPVKGSVFKAVNPPKATSHSALVTKDSVPTSVLVVKNCAVLVKFTRPKKKWISAVLSAYYSPLFGKNYQQRPWHYRTKLTEINTHGKQSVFHRPISWCSWR